MYSILIDRLQTETAQSILKDHEIDKDAQKMLDEVITYYEKSSMAKNRASVLFGQITSMKIHITRWNGTMRNFILHWVDKVREYHRLSGPSNVISESMKKAILMNLVKAETKLNDVIIRDMQRRRDGGTRIYDDFLEHLLQTADIFDGAVKASNRSTALNIHEHISPYDDVQVLREDLEDVKFSFNDGELEDDGEFLFNYTNNSRRSEFGPTVDGATWRSLNQDDQRAWNSLSPDGREIVAKFFNQKKKGIGNAPSMPKASSTPKFSNFCKTPKTTATNTSRTTIKTLE
jgi:hypothetical protein